MWNRLACAGINSLVQLSVPEPSPEKSSHHQGPDKKLNTKILPATEG